MPRTLFGLAIALASLLSSGPAGSADKQTCLEAHADSQRSRRLGHLKVAKALLLACSQKDRCPRPVAEDCTRWLSEVEAEQPTVVLAARDAEGQDLALVHVSLDGAPWVERLDGHTVEVDPGEHELRWEWPDGRTISSRLVVRAGEKARLVEVELESETPTAVPLLTAPATPVPVPPAGIPAASWTLWGIGLAAGASFAIVGLSGRSEESDLARTCRGQCSSDQVGDVRRKYVIADISWVAALVSVGIATWLAMRF
jgi:hypothetical protein